MAFIEISDLNAAGSDLFTGADSFLTELETTKTTQIFGGKKGGWSGGGKKHSGGWNGGGLAIDQETRQIAAKLVELGVVPGEKPGDALQMSVCVVHGIDYLLSWNYAHLVNPVAQQHLEEVCRKLSRRAPLLVSPESIPKVHLGQVIRRRES